MPEEPQLHHNATKLVDGLLQEAIDLNASDVHIEPQADQVRIRLRVDGSLREYGSWPLVDHESAISRLKILTKLDITEKRMPQDGRFSMAGTLPIDLRVSIFPTEYGECAVIRVLNQARMRLSFQELGLQAEQERLFKNIIHRPYGLILVTGPTGSGKTTTLFSILNDLNDVSKCTTTLEDPVEYRLPNLRQTQIRPDIGLDFAHGLRSIVRQNPDIIMVGEIRDQETANIAIQAALTGHLVLSTLHTNDSVGAMIRLREMGVEKFLITSATVGVIAQRLVRLICQSCRVAYEPSPELLKTLDLSKRPGLKFYKGAGCPSCQATGYRGQLGIFEILVPGENIGHLFYQDASWQDLKKHALAGGLRTLRMNGIEKVLQGMTTPEEILRVTGESLFYNA